jgi:hypothetical protein
VGLRQWLGWNCSLSLLLFLGWLLPWSLPVSIWEVEFSVGLGCRELDMGDSASKE